MFIFIKFQFAAGATIKYIIRFRDIKLIKYVLINHEVIITYTILTKYFYQYILYVLKYFYVHERVCKNT